MKFRHEYKQEINLSDITVLHSRLSAIFQHDENSSQDGTYFVKSLYFDNYFDSALREKADGVRTREKFRIRCYGTDISYINLEKKSKIGGLCSKEKARITAEECKKLLSNDTSFMKDDKRPLLYELYAKMQYKCLRARSIVGYTRESFVYPVGNVRVTLDYGIGISTDTHRFLDPSLALTPLPRAAVLEVKYDELLPDIVRDAVRLHSRRTGAFSKYALSRLY